MKICRIHRPPFNKLLMKFPQREFHILSRLEKRGHNVFRYTLVPVSIPSKYLSYGIGTFLSIIKFKFDKISSDVFIADNIESAVAAMLLKILCGRPFVFDFIDDYSAIARYDGCRLRHILIRFFERFLPKLADLVIVVDEHKKRYSLKLGINEDRIILIPDGTDTQKFCPEISPVNPINPNTPVKDGIVLYAGKINKYYQHETLIEAIPNVLSKFPDVRFIFVGDGDNVPRLKVLCSRLGIADAVFFVGFREPEEMPSLIACADVCIFPLPDSSALAIYEYMACGKPTVVPDCSTEKMGINGDLIPVDCVVRAENSPLGFARAINLLLADSRLREKIGARARQFVADSFDWNDLALRYEAALKQAVEDRKKHSTN